MNNFQDILVYITLGLAIAFLVKKFFIPKTVKSQKKENIKSCGQDSNCGCS